MAGWLRKSSGKVPLLLLTKNWSNFFNKDKALFWGQVKQLQRAVCGQWSEFPHRCKISKHNNRSLNTPKRMNFQKSFKQPLTPPPPLFVMPSLICLTKSVSRGHISVKTFQKHISETRNMAYQVGRTWHLPGWRTKCANLPEPATSLEIILRMTEKNANWTVYGLHLGFLIMFISNLIVHCIVWWFLATVPK